MPFRPRWVAARSPPCRGLMARSPLTRGAPFVNQSAAQSPTSCTYFMLGTPRTRIAVIAPSSYFRQEAFKFGLLLKEDLGGRLVEAWNPALPWTRRLSLAFSNEASAFSRCSLPP